MKVCSLCLLPPCSKLRMLGSPRLRPHPGLRQLRRGHLPADLHRAGPVGSKEDQQCSHRKFTPCLRVGASWTPGPGAASPCAQTATRAHPPFFSGWGGPVWSVARPAVSRAAQRPQVTCVLRVLVRIKGWRPRVAAVIPPYPTWQQVCAVGVPGTLGPVGR